MSGSFAEPDENAWVQRAAELKKRGGREMARATALTALGLLSGLGGLVRSNLSRNRVHLVYLHHVFRDERDPFRKLVRFLARGHRILPHSGAVDRILSGEIDRPYVSFSFDDGLKSCLTAAGILEEFGARGCFYVCTEMVGETRSEAVERFCRERLAMPPCELMDWDDLESLAGRGHEIGSHTRTHPDLAQLSPDLLEEEIAGSREVLLGRLGKADHFAWPYGTMAHFNSEAERRVFAAGYRSCASAVRGCHAPGGPVSKEDLILLRDHLPAGTPLLHARYFFASSSRKAASR